ncbi:MAG: septal ring lytic transglycosylase RlpA family protein [Bacteroidales bacterium]
MKFSFSFFIFSTILLLLISQQGILIAQTKNVKTGIASYYHGWLDGKKTANGEKYDESQMTAAHPSLPFNSKVKVTNLNNQKSIVVRINDRGPFINKRIIDLSRAAADSLDFIFNGLAKVQLTVLSYGKPNDATHQQLLASQKTVKKQHTEVQKETILPKDSTIASIPIEQKEITKLSEIKIEEKVIPESKIIAENLTPTTIISESKVNESNALTDNTFYGLQLGSFKVKNNADKLLEKIKLSYKGEINIQEFKKGNTGFFRLIIGKFADEKEVLKLRGKLKKDYPESFMIRY